MHTTGDARGRGPAATPFPPGINYLNSINETAKATNRSRSSVYLMIAAGELEAVKDGSRTLVYGHSIVERTRSLPRANVGKRNEAA